MVVRIHNLSKWACLPAGDVLQLSSDHHRKVRVEVNCPAPTRFDVAIENPKDPQAKSFFLGVVQGHEVLEFSAEGMISLVPQTEDEVWYFTDDDDQFAVENPDAVSFTTIANRMARNPELERMMYKMEQNMNRRLALLDAEWQQQRAADAERQGADRETGELNEQLDQGPDSAGGEGADDQAAAQPDGGAPKVAKAGGATAKAKGADDGK